MTQKPNKNIKKQINTRSYEVKKASLCLSVPVFRLICLTGILQAVILGSCSLTSVFININSTIPAHLRTFYVESIIQVNREMSRSNLMGSLPLEGRNWWVELDGKEYRCCKSYKIKWYKSRRISVK